uniref:Si:ch73-252i11.1 n=1 Tax=Neogobius melanostomus TaxID=47308 RepID=A0A8C6TEE8_9GOBI
METEVLKYILDNHGAVDTSDLLFNLCDTATLSELICKNEKFLTCLFNGTPKVVVRSPVSLCWRKGCPGCGGLHLCKGFLLTGSCQFSLTRRGCIFSHNLLSDYNEKILKKFGLETLSRAQLCVLLLQSNNNLLPCICYNYNNRNGCQDSCKRLHICEKFLCQDCSCFRTHDFLAPQPSMLLQNRRIPDSLIKSLKSVYANKVALQLADKPDNRRNRGDRGNSGLSDQKAVSNFDISSDFEYDSSQGTHSTGCESSSDVQTSRGRGVRGRSSNFRGGFFNNNHTLNYASHGDLMNYSTKEVSFTSPKHSTDKRQGQGKRDKTEICMYFIKGRCKHEDRCFKAHDKMPYRWEIKQDGQWTHMAANESIELAYCDPANSYSTSCPLVYFDTMKCGEKEVRRLSTINAVLEPNFIHTTDWLWFWEDNHGKWLQYGAHANVHEMASVSSKQLEEMYLNNNKDVVQFKAGSQLYELSFQDMIQTNIKYGTKRIVRRRPRFVSAAEVQTKRKQPTNPTTFPVYWDKTQISQTEHRCISLQPSLGEYKEIHDLFCQTMKGFDILKIERIQNKAVWEAFQLHKNHLNNKNNGQAVTEKKLFHGTDPSLVNTICATNFDWRVCGVNGTAYGQGSYFARDAKYSHSYTGTSDVRFMIVSRVLVGEYTRGRSEYRRPPSKDGGDVNLYDSCVDNVMNPSIFVVFEKQQIYPEYVIQYSERSQHTIFTPPAPLITVMTPPVPVSKSSASPVATNAFLTTPTTSSLTSSSNAAISNLATTSTAVSSNVSVTQPTPTSSTSSSNAAISNLATTSTSVSSNVSVTQPTPTSSTSSSNAAISNLATTSSSVSSNASVTNPPTTFSRSSSAFTSNPPPSSTKLSHAFPYPTQTSFTSSPNNLRTNLTTSSNPRMFTSDSSFRFAATTLQATTSPTRTTTAFLPSSSRKKQNKCVIA